MDERTRERVNTAITSFLESLVVIADAGNYDRDSFLKASIAMVNFMLEVCTFKNDKSE